MHRIIIKNMNNGHHRDAVCCGRKPITLFRLHGVFKRGCHRSHKSRDLCSLPLKLFPCTVTRGHWCHKLELSPIVPVPLTLPSRTPVLAESGRHRNRRFRRRSTCCSAPHGGYERLESGWKAAKHPAKKPSAGGWGEARLRNSNCVEKQHKWQYCWRHGRRAGKCQDYRWCVVRNIEG